MKNNKKLYTNKIKKSIDFFRIALYNIKSKNRLPPVFGTDEHFKENEHEKRKFDFKAFGRRACRMSDHIGICGVRLRENAYVGDKGRKDIHDIDRRVFSADENQKA